MTIKNLSSSLLLVIMIGLPVSAHPSSEIIIVGHLSAPTLTKAEAEQIFLGKTRKFPNSTNVKPIDQPNDESIYALFYKKLTNKNLTKVKAYWARMIFTGAAEPPTIVYDSDELKELIVSDSRFIGYMDLEELDDSVKVLYQLPQ